MADTRYFVVTPDAEVILYYTQDDDVMGSARRYEAPSKIFTRPLIQT